jgi:hypothetical protein
MMVVNRQIAVQFGTQFWQQVRLSVLARARFFCPDPEEEEKE